jgi:hypothetical protein
MVNHGEIGEYRIVAWADGFDPSLDDLLPHVAETIEPPRKSRRLQLLRRWSHESKQVFP